MKKELKEDLEKLMAFIPNEYRDGKGYQEGWIKEANDMRKAIDDGVEITEKWCMRDLTVHLSASKKEIGEWMHDWEMYQPMLFFNGSYGFRSLAQNLVHFHSLENPSKEVSDYRNRIFEEFLK
jgi:hypothetical protein